MSLTFDNASHTYRWNGAVVPSVTQVLKPLTDFSAVPAGVHEAVHAWQEWCDYYGEVNPGREQEAYGVQAVSQELMAEFSRRMAKQEVKP